MTQELKDLLETIQQEGVEAAQETARRIEEEAKNKAQILLADAGKQAQMMLQEARERIAKDEASTKATLKQAGRDMMLALRHEITAMLSRVVTTEIRGVLKPEEMVRMIFQLIQGVKESGDIVVSFSPQDRERMEKAFLTGLKSQMQSGITVRSAENIGAGFTISFDSGRSAFHFTDQSLSEYICGVLKPRLAEMLQDAQSSA